MSVLVNLRDDFYGSFSERFKDDVSVRALLEWEKIRSAEMAWKCTNMAMVRIGFVEAVNTLGEAGELPASQKVGYLTP